MTPAAAITEARVALSLNTPAVTLSRSAVIALLERCPIVPDAEDFLDAIEILLEGHENRIVERIKRRRKERITP